MPVRVDADEEAAARKVAFRGDAGGELAAYLCDDDTTAVPVPGSL
jgi:hypothetical protein